MLNRKVETFIRQQHLLQSDGRYLVALSGGADSVCLLLVLKQLGYFVEAIHCNFHLRGEESDRDEDFCRNLCAEKQIPLHLVHFDTREYAQLHKVSIEMAARQLRYHHFASLCHDLGFDGVCVAHHQDDVAETVLMNLIRGTGIKGLSGIKPKIQQRLRVGAKAGIPIPLTVIRPLLCVTRDEIEHFLKEIGQDYVTDSTNLVPDVLRNKIRLQVLPLLDEIAPSASRNIVETAENVAFAEEFLDQAVSGMMEELKEEGSIPVSKIKSEYLLFRILSDYGFTSVQIKQIYAHLDAPTGTEFRSESHILVFDRGRLLIEEVEKNPFYEMRIPEEGTYILDETAKLRMERMPKPEGFEIPRSSDVIAVDADRLQMPLTVRLPKEGDRFTPFGMQGSKLVSDFLTDQKLSLLEKRRQLIILDSTGRILWVVGLRPDNHFRITDSTRTILHLTIEKQ
jgi:tRNA(Ile)-lysidine synthase